MVRAVKQDGSTCCSSVGCGVQRSGSLHKHSESLTCTARRATVAGEVQPVLAMAAQRSTMCENLYTNEIPQSSLKHCKCRQQPVTAVLSVAICATLHCCSLLPIVTLGSRGGAVYVAVVQADVNTAHSMALAEH